jgi:hypothetical protein
MAVFFSKSFGNYALIVLSQHLNYPRDEIYATPLAETLHSKTYKTNITALRAFTSNLNRFPLEDEEFKKGLIQNASKDLEKFYPLQFHVLHTCGEAQQTFLQHLAERLLDEERYPHFVQREDWVNFAKQFDFTGGVISAEEFNRRHESLQSQFK